MRSIISIIHEMDGLNELAEKLDVGECALIGEDAEQKRAFYLIVFSEIEGGTEIFRLGIVSEGHGLKPQYEIKDEYCIIGVNHELYNLSLKTYELRKKKMDSLFFEFSLRADLDLIICVCEANIYCFKDNMEERWRICPDLIEGYRFFDDYIHIETESGKFYYSLYDGHVIKDYAEL